ncbi:MAG: tripartite tricarboxylate transporter substrate binding protein [Betaproteobacteria bacterium]|nr:tripartite tricarboxylate transporter substrate binding protein [Betaproteobacteria bacterium]
MTSIARITRTMGALFALAGWIACAGAYPEKPVRIIVPTTQGGGADTLARHIATRLSDRWRQQVLVDNRPGANGITGVEAAAKSAADGYTLLMTFTDHFVNPSLYRSLPFNMARDFAPIVFVGSLPFVLAVNPAVAANSVQELIALARARPGQLNFGSAGTGGSVHLAGELFKATAGIDITHVPYKGTSAAMPDLVSGRIEMMFPSAITAKPFADNGRLRLLAVTGAQRSPDVPQLPTVAESGLPGFDVGIWYGMLAPAGTPPEITKKLNAEIRDIVGAEEFRALMAKQGVTVAPGTPEQFSAFYLAEMRKWAKVVKDANIPPIN